MEGVAWEDEEVYSLGFIINGRLDAITEKTNYSTSYLISRELHMGVMLSAN
jgi:hypothetical protein